MHDTQKCLHVLSQSTLRNLEKRRCTAKLNHVLFSLSCVAERHDLHVDGMAL